MNTAPVLLSLQFLEYFPYGCCGGFMTVVISELGLCPVLPKCFSSHKGWNAIMLKIAFVLCGGMMAFAWGSSDIPITNGLILIAAGAGWHKLLLGWSPLVSTLKSVFEAWKKMGESPLEPSERSKVETLSTISKPYTDTSIDSPNPPATN